MLPFSPACFVVYMWIELPENTPVDLILQILLKLCGNFLRVQDSICSVKNMLFKFRLSETTSRTTSLTIKNPYNSTGPPFRDSQSGNGSFLIILRITKLVLR
mmetsp:Transcript_32912/g.37337  ORF Transcript_32912/g.37337 Transcript_32912/m.37337 type:complete len:102 (-) Transcript_32912:2918-3223(-)